MLHSLVRRHALPPSTQLRCVFFSTGTYVSSSGTTASPDPHFMVEYLVNTWGFSADDASKVSKSLPCFQSTEKPDAVLGFFRSHGLDGANLRKIISWRPGFLCGDVENSLAPKFKILRDMGLSESDIANAVLRHPFILYLDAQNALLPRLKAWESLFGSKEILLRNLRGYNRFLSASIENVNPESLRALVDRAEGLGVPRGSGMFLWILDVLQQVSTEKFEAQLKLMNNFGLSNSDFISAIKKFPRFLLLSTESLQRKMEFLVNVVGSSPSDVALRPVPLVLCLEKRLIPRFRVMEILKAEGLWKSTNKLHVFFSSSGPKFLKQYVLPYEDKLPKLREVL
ncbi:transcription termination factor MTERF15, mitochondrial-like isoform X1 [Zingiber officinale]|uniref:transcription termination factor MTERF15, mitochondrial-like isoform X1 n=1 Tax=Zingiber officinale TaxID=94328 RepID=UPI001C4C578F|nr:transcription termination factor MTERF15, mitochondrial-like isoform X1 [Zingiber officinale]